MLFLKETKLWQQRNLEQGSRSSERNLKTYLRTGGLRLRYKIHCQTNMIFVCKMMLCIAQEMKLSSRVFWLGERREQEREMTINSGG